MTDTYEFLKAQKDAILAKQEDERWAWMDAAIADITHYKQRIAELERTNAVLLGACKTFCEWLDREERGFVSDGRTRDTPEGEAEWHRWYYGNLDLCKLAQEQARAAIAEVK